MTFTHIRSTLLAYRQSISSIRERKMISREWEEIELKLSKMTVAELLELRALVDNTIEAAEMRERREELGLAETAAEPVAENGAGAKGSKSGYIELKTINGCGPYAYRRARVGGRLTSEYLGKVKE